MRITKLENKSARVAASHLVKLAEVEGHVGTHISADAVRNIRNFIGAIREYTGIPVGTSYDPESKLFEVHIKKGMK